MTQDEAIIIKKKQEYYSSLADIDKKLIMIVGMKTFGEIFFGIAVFSV